MLSKAMMSSCRNELLPSLFGRQPHLLIWLTRQRDTFTPTPRLEAASFDCQEHTPCRYLPSMFPCASPNVLVIAPDLTTTTYLLPSSQQIIINSLLILTRPLLHILRQTPIITVYTNLTTAVNMDRIKEVSKSSHTQPRHS